MKKLATMNRRGEARSPLKLVYGACPGHRAAPPGECPALRRAFVLGADHEAWRERRRQR
jgi:hypothetical protein